MRFSCLSIPDITPHKVAVIKQLLDEVEQNIVICLWRADQLFADAEGKGK